MRNLPVDIVSDRVFVNQDVVVDDVLYQRCQFRRCRIVFRGTGRANFDGCLFDECEWVFDDAAENTLEYLAYMYSGLDAGGRALVDGIFERIRRGGVGHGNLRETTAVGRR